MICDVGEASELILQPFRCFTYVTSHSPTLLPLHLRHSSFYNPSAASPTSQAILQPFCCFTYVTGTSRTSPGELPMHSGMKNSVWWTSLLQQFTKFRSSYSFGQLLKILLRAINLFSFSHTVSSDSSFNIHNALYFVKYPSRAAQSSPEGHGLKTHALEFKLQ